jgi:hypothetical protein
MKRKAGALVLLAALGGCMSTDKTGPTQGQFGAVTRTRQVGGVQGPWGEPVPVTTAKPAAAPVADTKNDTGVVQASATMPAGVKKDATVVSASATMPAGAKKDAGVVQAVATAPAGAKKDDGVVRTSYQVNKGTAPGLVNAPPGAVAAVGALPGIPIGRGGPGAAAGRTSIRFTTPAGMKVAWYAPSPESRNGFTPAQVEVPGRYNFVQGGVYRLKLSDIPNRPALELYPTLEVMPANHRTCTFLAHSAVPVGFTEEDFEQVAAGNFVVKVIYLPDPQFQDLAVAGPDEVVSTRLEPGVDPILEAQRRGSILCVIRIGNIDLEAPNTPSMNAPPQMGPYHGMPLMTAPGSVPPGMMPPQGMMPPGAMPPGAMPPGAMPPAAMPPAAIPPGTLPRPGTQTLPPPAAAMPMPNAGRASVSVPADPPAVRLPDAPPALPNPATNVSVGVDGVIGRMK